MKTHIIRTVNSCTLILVIVCSGTLAASGTAITRQMCNSNYCLNGGVCRASKMPGVSFCSCPPAFFGPRCQFNTETEGYCRLTPCQHGGSCYQWGTDQQDFHCFCDEPYYGDLCQYNAGLYDPCNEKPCKDTETCVPFGIQSAEFYCF